MAAVALSALVDAAAALAAVWLVARLTRGERRLVLAACAAFALSAALSPASYIHDHFHHFLHAREAARDAMRLLDPWDRPAFMLLYTAPARLGLGAARAMSLVPAAAALAATMLAARSLRLAPWIAGALLFAQPDWFGEASSTMTELLFSAGLAVAIWAFCAKRPWLAAAGLGLLSISRPEGPLFAGLGALALLLRAWPKLGPELERPKTPRLGPAAAALAPFALYLLAGAAAHRDWLWYVTQNPYRGGVALRTGGLAELWHSYFFTALAQGQQPAGLALAAAGAALALSSPGRRFRFLLWPLLVSYLLLSFLKIGQFDWWRQSRYLVAMGPPLALLAAAGLAAALQRLPRAASFVLLAGAALGSAGALIEKDRPPIAWGAPPVLAVFALLVLGALALWLWRARLAVPVSLCALLALPLVASPPGSFARHRPTPGESLDAAAMKWLARAPWGPVAFDTVSLAEACDDVVAEPCPLPLARESLASPAALDGSGARYAVKWFPPGTAPWVEPPGWREAWRGELAWTRGPLLFPRPMHEATVIYEKLTATTF